MLTGTVFPLLVEALQDKQITVGEPYFDRLGAPIGLALLFLMAVGPALPWRAPSGEVLRNRLLIPAWVGVAHACVVALRRRRRTASPSVVAFALGAFALAEHRPAVRASARARAGAAADEAWPRRRRCARCAATRGSTAGLRRAHRRRRDRDRARATSGAYSDQARGAADAGRVGDRVAATPSRTSGSVTHKSAQKTTIQARVRITHGGSELGVYAPRDLDVPELHRRHRHAVGPHRRSWHDVYLTLVSSPNAARPGHDRRRGQAR